MIWYWPGRPLGVNWEIACGTWSWTTTSSPGFRSETGRPLASSTTRSTTIVSGAEGPAGAADPAASQSRPWIAHTRKKHFIRPPDQARRASPPRRPQSRPIICVESSNKQGAADVQTQAGQITVERGALDDGSYRRRVSRYERDAASHGEPADRPPRPGDEGLREGDHRDSRRRPDAREAERGRAKGESAARDGSAWTWTSRSRVSALVVDTSSWIAWLAGEARPSSTRRSRKGGCTFP